MSVRKKSWILWEEGLQISPPFLVLSALPEVRLGFVSGAALFWALVVLNQGILGKISQGLGKSELITPFICNVGPWSQGEQMGPGWIKNKTVLDLLCSFSNFHCWQRLSDPEMTPWESGGWCWKLPALDKKKA